LNSSKMKGQSMKNYKQKNIFHNIKVMVRYVIIISMVFLLFACKGKDDAIEVSKYFGKSVKTFQRKMGIHLIEEVSDVYLLEETIQVITRKNKISSISILNKGLDYSLFNVKIGMEKEIAEKILNEKFNKPSKTLNSAKDALVFTYYDDNNELYLTIDASNDKIIEMAYYKFDDINQKDNSYQDESGNNGKLIAVIGNSRLYYNEAMVYLKSVQQSYENEYGNKIWDSDLFGNGVTFGQTIKNEVMKNITEIKIINSKAKELGISLAEEEISVAKEYAKEHYYSMTTEDIDRYLITEELLEKVYKDNILAEKVFETATLKVDTNILDAETKQITIQNIYIKKPKIEEELFDDVTGENGLENELEIAYNAVKDLAEKAKTSENFYALAEANSESDVIEYIFGRGEGPIDYGVEFEDAAFKLETGQVSSIIETDDGWHIIYCKTSYNEDATIQKKESIIEDRRNRKFEMLFSEWSKDYEVIVSLDTWNKVTFD